MEFRVGRELEAMQTGTPIIALKTGGLTRQAIDHRDGSENGVALDVEFKSIVGSQQVPFIFEDYVSTNSVANGIMRLFELDEKRFILARLSSVFFLITKTPNGRAAREQQTNPPYIVHIPVLKNEALSRDRPQNSYGNPDGLGRYL